MDRLTDEEEKTITEMMADTFHFIKKGKGYVCCHCGVRFQNYSIGMPINERMIMHAEHHGIGHDLKQ
jgi:hypothetical protein